MAKFDPDKTRNLVKADIERATARKAKIADRRTAAQDKVARAEAALLKIDQDIAAEDEAIARGVAYLERNPENAPAQAVAAEGVQSESAVGTF